MPLARRTLLGALVAVLVGSSGVGRTERDPDAEPEPDRTVAAERATAVVDRIEPVPDGESRAVLLVERDREAERLVVDVTALPPFARDEGAVVAVRVGNGTLLDATSRPRATTRRRRLARKRFARLAERPRRKSLTRAPERRDDAWPFDDGAGGRNGGRPRRVCLAVGDADAR